MCSSLLHLLHCFKCFIWWCAGHDSQIRTRRSSSKNRHKKCFSVGTIYPGDLDLLGFAINGSYYINKCLPMGFSSSCKIWEKFEKVLHWLIQYMSGLNTLDHYLDDFIFVGRSGSQDFATLMFQFESLTREMGVPLAKDKTTGPTTRLSYLRLIQ